MSLFSERIAPLDGGETVAILELMKPKRTYHQPSRDLRNWVVDYALLRPTRTLRRWLEENKEEGRDPRGGRVDAAHLRHLPRNVA